MLRWSKYDIQGKGQFFVISVVIIATSLAGLLVLLEVYEDMRITDTHVRRGEDVFREVKEGLVETAYGSSCSGGNQPRKRNLEDFIYMVSEEARGDGMYLDVEIDDDSICNEGEDLVANLTLRSEGLEISESLLLISSEKIECLDNEDCDNIEEGWQCCDDGTGWYCYPNCDIV